MHRLPLVSDFMDKSFATVTPETSMNDAIKVLVKQRLTGVLVVDARGALVGVLSEKDCLHILLRHGFDPFPDDVVASYMHPVRKTIPSSTDIIRAAQIFLEPDTSRRLAVVDEGKLVGQITRRDIIKGMGRYRR